MGPDHPLGLPALRQEGVADGEAELAFRVSVWALGGESEQTVTRGSDRRRTLEF